MPQKVDAKKLSLGKALVDNLSVEKFDLGQYSDTYAKELEKLIQPKSKGQQITIKEEEKEPEETPDIVEALKASLQVKSKSSKQKRIIGTLLWITYQRIA
jgi:non-homologous end joining protein Ku